MEGGGERERERGKGGRGSTVNSPIQCSYHLPLSLTTHRRHLRIVPPTLQVRLADVPCLTGKLNRYFTVSYPLRSLSSPRPFLSRAASLSLSFLLRGPLFVSGRRTSEREGGGGPSDGQRGGEASSFPPIALPRSSSGSGSSMGQRRSAPRCCLRELCVRVANIYLHIVLHVTIMYAPG